MRTYEELFIIKPDAPVEEVDAYVGQIKDIITGSSGSIEKEDKWGTRKLAYRIMKYNEGVYILLQFTAGPTVVQEIERRMRVSDLVIKFITVRMDERLKKIDKRRKHREKRAARRPAPAPVAAPSMPTGEPSAPVPGAPMPGAPAPAHAAPAVPVAVAEQVGESGE
jgi:small subunit ribosomal protein S6